MPSSKLGFQLNTKISLAACKFVNSVLGLDLFVKIFLGNLEGFLVQPLIVSLLGYKSQSTSFPVCKVL